MADEDGQTEDEALMLKICCRRLQRWERRYLLRVSACVLDRLLVIACEIYLLHVSACDTCRRRLAA